MMRARVRTIAALAVLAAALALVAAGRARQHKVYDPQGDEFGMAMFTRVSERDLTIDATFGGATRRAGRLYTTYDRSAPRGKRACPT